MGDVSRPGFTAGERVKGFLWRVDLPDVTLLGESSITVSPRSKVEVDAI